MSTPSLPDFPTKASLQRKADAYVAKAEAHRAGKHTVKVRGCVPCREAEVTGVDRRKLVRTEGVTLDGEPAKISGARLDFPIIISKSGKSVEFSWLTVAHKVASGRLDFQS